ncbi:MAG: hypothetical protein V7695_24105 [Sulfitobacter sp.]
MTTSLVWCKFYACRCRHDALFTQGIVTRMGEDTALVTSGATYSWFSSLS